MALNGHMRTTAAVDTLRWDFTTWSPAKTMAVAGEVGNWLASKLKREVSVLVAATLGYIRFCNLDFNFFVVLE